MVIAPMAAVADAGGEVGGIARRFWIKYSREAAYAKYSAFVVGLAAGELKIDSFRHFVSQDFHFLKSFADAYELAKECADDGDAKLAISELRKGVADKLKLHNSLEWRIDPSKEGNVNSATVRYTDFLLATASGKIDGVEGPVKLATPFERRKVAACTLGAMTPCMRLYAFLGKELQAFLDPKDGSHPYKKWIDTYSSESFQASALQTEDLLDKLSVSLTGEELDVIEKLYHQAMILKIDFFNAQPLAQPAVVPLTKEDGPNEDRLIIFSDFDLTCSVVESSTILVDIAIVAAPESDPAQGADQIVRMTSVELRNTWDSLSAQYTEEYEQCIESILPSEKVVFNYEGLCKALVQLSYFEQRASSRVVESSVLKGLNIEDIKKAGERLILQDGCISFFQKIVNNEKLNANVHLLSYCWCADLIRSAFSSGGLMAALHVHANELAFDQSVTTGEIVRKVESPADKVRVFKNLLTSCTGDKKNLTVYIGESVGDLLCLLEADIGIVIGSSSSLRRVGNQFGVSFVPMFPGLVEKQKGAKGSSPDWNRLSGVLYTVTSWAEIHAFILGRTGLSQAVVASQPLLASNSLKFKIRVKAPRLDNQPTDSSSTRLDLPLIAAQGPISAEPLRIELPSKKQRLMTAIEYAEEWIKTLAKEGREAHLKTIREGEKNKKILRLVPHAWWLDKLVRDAPVTFQNGKLDGGKEETKKYQVIFARHKDKKGTCIPLLRGERIAKWYLEEGLATYDHCVLEFVDEHTVKYYPFHIKDYPGSTPGPSSSSIPTTYTGEESTDLNFNEVKDLTSFRFIFSRDRECGKPKPESEFPEDVLEDYYKLCSRVKRFIHGNKYATDGADIVDPFIKKMIEIHKKTSNIVRMELKDVAVEELKEVMHSLVLCEKIGFDLGIVGKTLRDIKLVEDTINHMEKKYEEVVGSYDEVSQ